MPTAPITQARQQLDAAADQLHALRSLLTTEDGIELRWSLPDLDETIDALHRAHLIDLVHVATTRLATEIGGPHPDASAQAAAARIRDTLRNSYPDAPDWRIVRAIDAMTDALKKTRPIAD